MAVGPSFMILIKNVGNFMFDSMLEPFCTGYVLEVPCLK